MPAFDLSTTKEPKAKASLNLCLGYVQGPIGRCYKCYSGNLWGFAIIVEGRFTVRYDEICDQVPLALVA